jgi:hypothetical protein
MFLSDHFWKENRHTLTITFQLNRFWDILTWLSKKENVKTSVFKTDEMGNINTHISNILVVTV